MRARIQKWGNSLAVRIPKALAAEADLDQDSEVELSLVDGSLVIAPAPTRFTLEELVAGITDENRHGETDWGKPVGKEVW